MTENRDTATLSSPRTYLFVPGNRPERFDKAIASGADAVIIDLEDAVPPGERPAARENVLAWVSDDHPVLIRVNGAGTEWHREDVALANRAGVTAIVLPKAERVEHIRLIEKPVLAIIETARGFWNVTEIAHAPNVRRLMFGSIDFQVDLGIHGEGEELLYFRSQLVLVSRIAGLNAPVDGITAAFDTPDRIRADTERARRLGFGAKLCIHPKQIPIVHECFGPTRSEEAWAKRVMDAASKSGGAAASMDGEMIDRPVIARAEAILSYRRSNS
jgi:citrate lyase subunit beta/citryl-CoA lyase